MFSHTLQRAQAKVTERKGTRTCEENLARRAWSSAYERHPPRLKQHLRYLLTLLDSPRPVYRRIANTALAQHDEEPLLKAIKAVGEEIDLCRANQLKVATISPNLYAILNAA